MHSHWKFWILCLIGLVLISAPVKGEDSEYQGEENDDEEEDVPSDFVPVITTQPKTFQEEISSTVRMPCHGEYLKYVGLLWRRGDEIIVVGDAVVGDEKRITIENAGTDLVITNLTTSDAGAYTCSVSHGHTPASVTHKLDILSPPRAQFPSTSLVIKQGEPITLTCLVGGFPVPTVTWERKKKPLLHGEQKTEGSISSIVYASASRHHSGVYECVASNRFGEARTAINVEITYAPEIDIERESVHSGKGNEVELKCTVHAEPKAILKWYMNGREIKSSRHEAMHDMNHVHTLHIKNVNDEDYGNYTCIANNTYGRTTKAILLSEAPSQPVLQQGTMGEDHMTYKLVWVLDSTVPVNEYKLKFRKISDAEWKEMDVEGQQTQGHVYTVEYVLKGLSPSSDYEATLSARNEFGSSKESRVHSFHINGEYQSLEADAEPGAKAAVGSNGAGCMVSSSQQTFALFLAVIVTNLLRWQ